MTKYPHPPPRPEPTAKRHTVRRGPSIAPALILLAALAIVLIWKGAL